MDTLAAIESAYDVTNQVYKKIDEELNKKIDDDFEKSYDLIVKLYRFMCKKSMITNRNIGDYADISISTHKRLHCGCFNGEKYPTKRLDLESVLNICIGLAQSYELAMSFWFVSGYATEQSLSEEQRLFYQEIFKKYCGKPNTEQRIKVTKASEAMVKRGYPPIVELIKRKRKEK